MERTTNIRTNLFLALIASLTLGLTPFVPEPHIVGKIRWILGGAHGMQMMDYLDLVMHGLPWLVLLYYIYKFILLKNSEKMNIQDILQEPDVKIIDVREKYEFETDHIVNAINMPLSNFASYTDEIKSMTGKKIFYCRSGNRSGQAVKHLAALGVKDVQNGGSLGLMKSLTIK